MTAPAAKRGKTVLTTSDPCPRGCKTIATGAAHLLSDHSEEKARQCSLCACVIQDTHTNERGTSTLA